MKIRWQKIAAGVYQTDTGRWILRKYPQGLVWWIFDVQTDLFNPVGHNFTLRDAKLFVDQQIEKEASNVSTN